VAQRQGREETRSATRRAAGSAGPGKAAASRSRRVGATAADEGREVAATAADEAQETAATAAEQSREVAASAADEGRRVARRAARDARELAGTVSVQAEQVSQEIAEQGRSVVEETTTQLEEQARAQTERLAQALRQLGTEAQALAEGRPADAGTVRDYVSQASERLLEAAGRLEGVADDIDSRGLQGVLEDVQRFARRRPGVFLVGAAIAGFGVGRAVRSSGDGEAAPTRTPARALGAGPVSRRRPTTGAG
jgi:DNA anti-recombination protein RmuC